MLESNQHLAIIDRGPHPSTRTPCVPGTPVLDLRANPARSTTSLRSLAQGKLWCAVRELNPHLLGVGQLFWSVELPAQKSGGGCRSRTCLAALMHPTARKPRALGTPQSGAEVGISHCPSRRPLLGWLAMAFLSTRHLPNCGRDNLVMIAPDVDAKFSRTWLCALGRPGEKNRTRDTRTQPNRRRRGS